MNMETSKETTFAELKSFVSDWYDEHVPINMLKVLFKDHVANTFKLHASPKTIDLMNMLTTSGSLSPTDLTLLYDTIKATEQFGLEDEIKNKMPSFQLAKNIRDTVITKFTPHRQRLVKLGMALTPSDVQKISELYDVKHTDSWSLIMDLEHKTLLCEKGIYTFIDKLKTHNLHQAVKSLTEDIKLTLKRKRENGQPNPGYVLNLLEELDEYKELLNLRDKTKGFVRLRSIVSYYKSHGLDLKGIENGSIVFHLSTHDPDSLMHLWKIHSNGMLIKDLAQILVPQKYQQEFLDEWMTYIDENEYEAALSKLKGEEEKDLETESFSETVQGTSKSLSKDKEHDVGSAHETTFAVFKSFVSDWYDEHVPINVLKVLFKDHVINTYKLHTTSKTIDLMNMLTASGSLSPTDLTLLYDTIKATEQFGLEEEIKNKMPSFKIDKNIRDTVITIFTPHRQRLVKLGMALTPSDVQKISDLYKVKCTDSWSLIMELEHTMVICEENMDTFIDKLKTHSLHQAVKSLTEDILNPSSNPGQASDVKLILKRKKEDDQQHPKYVLNFLEELDECKDILTLKENPKGFVKFRSMVSYYEGHGLYLKSVGGFIVFELSTKDPDSLMHLWEMHSSGKLIHDLADLLVPEMHQQQEFLDEWMTYIDENEYKAALDNLEEEDDWKAVCIFLTIIIVSSLMYVYQETVTLDFMIFSSASLYMLHGLTEKRVFNVFILLIIIFVYITWIRFFVVAPNPYHYYYSKLIEYVLIGAIILFIAAFLITELESITSKIAKYIYSCTIVIIYFYLLYHFFDVIFYVKSWLIYFIDICYTTYVLHIIVGIDE